MRAPVILAFLVWPVAFIATVAGLTSYESRGYGQIVEERAAYCEFFVVKADREYLLMEVKREFNALAGGRHVHVLPKRDGVQMIRVDNRATIEVKLLDKETYWDDAYDWFVRRCDPERPGLPRTIDPLQVAAPP